MARRYTDRIHQHAYESHPQQWRWALATLPFAHEWVFAIDADFAVTPALWRSDRGRRPARRSGHRRYFVRHRQVFLGRWLRHGTMYPRYRLLLFRRQRVQMDPTTWWMRSSPWRVGPVGWSRTSIEDNVKDRDIAFWIQKQIRFAERQAVEEIRRPGDRG